MVKMVAHQWLASQTQRPWPGRDRLAEWYQDYPSNALSRRRPSSDRPRPGQGRGSPKMSHVRANHKPSITGSFSKRYPHACSGSTPARRSSSADAQLATLCPHTCSGSRPARRSSSARCSARWRSCSARWSSCSARWILLLGPLEFLLSPLAFLLGPLIFLLGALLAGRHQHTVCVCPAQPRVVLALKRAFPQRQP